MSEGTGGSAEQQATGGGGGGSSGGAGGAGQGGVAGGGSPGSDAAAGAGASGTGGRLAADAAVDVSSGVSSGRDARSNDSATGGSDGAASKGGAADTGASGGSSTTANGGAGSGGSTAASGGSGGATSAGEACGAGDGKLPAEPTIPPACTTLSASQVVAAGGVPSETSLDTKAIQAALDGCGAGKAVKLAASDGKNAFITGPLTIPAGVSLWVDAGATLYATRDPSVWGSASALLSVSGANSGIVGEGTIDGQGGEPNLGSSQSWWDQNAGSSGDSPALIAVRGASQFTLYKITLHDSPKFHVKLGADGFVVWGVTIKAPAKASNSAGTALSYSNAHNTDGIDPGEAASNGYIVCSKISTGDDHIAIKGSSSTGVSHLTIAHNRFGAGHGMSIGSEFTGGVSDVSVYDLSIDGQGMGTSGGSSNGIRIKSDTSRGGLVDHVTYDDVCVRNLSNPILLTPAYSSATGLDIPQYTNITIRNFHVLGGGSNTPKVTLEGYDAAHLGSITLDNVIIDGVVASNVTAAYTTVTLGPGAVNFTPSGTGVSVSNAVAGSSTPNPCTGKWTTF